MTEARKDDPAPEAQPEVIEIPNDDTIVVGGEEGVTVSPPETPETDVKPAEEAEPTLMDEVEKALESERTPSDPDPKEAKAEEGEADKTEDETGDETAEPTELSAEPTDAELENYSKKAQQRIRGLIDQRNDATRRAEAVEPILDFLVENDIPKQDLDVVLDLTARLRHGDFAGFLTAVQPYVNLAMQYTGQVLPKDLKEQVQQGYVSPDVARELAQRRAQQHLGEHQQAQTQRRSQEELGRAKAENIRNAVVQWETQIKASDPDYDLKADVVRRTAQAMMQERGVPETSEQAIQYVNDAYAEVNEQMKKLRPAPKPTAAVPSSTASKGGTAPTPEASSMMEAAMQGLQAHRG